MWSFSCNTTSIIFLLKIPNQVIIFLTHIFLIVDTLANQNVIHGAALASSGNLVETSNHKSHHRGTISESAFHRIPGNIRVYPHYI